MNHHDLHHQKNKDTCSDYPTSATCGCTATHQCPAHTTPTPSRLSRREALLEVKYKLEDALETINRFLKE